MQIPFVDLKSQYLSIKPEIDQAIQNVINDTAFIKGKYVNDFENAFREIYGVEHCIGVGNGTDAIFIALKMLNIGLGDEVITSAHSWIATSEMITQTGAQPVFVDIDEFFTIDVDKIEEKITENTKAIIPVHIYGQMSDMKGLTELCKKYNLYLLEDCAQSHFSEYQEKRAGAWGEAGTFSFFPGKNLGAYGDAGCILTNNNELANKMRMFANHGALKKHFHEIEGMNSRLDGLQAAILSAKLPSILEWTEKRINNARYYDQILSDVKDVEIPKVRQGTKHTYHLYVIRAQKRDELKAFLEQKGIGVAIHYPTPLPFLKAYGYLNKNEKDFPKIAQAQKEILSIPMFPELTFEMMDYVAEQIKIFYTP